MASETQASLANTDESAAILEQMLAYYGEQRADLHTNLEYFEEEEEEEERGALYEEGCELMAAEEASQKLVLFALVEEASAASWAAECGRRCAVSKPRLQLRGVAPLLRGVAPSE